MRARYSLGVLFDLVTTIACGLAGYHEGFRRGDNVWRYSSIYLQQYPVYDLVDQEAGPAYEGNGWFVTRTNADRLMAPLGRLAAEYDATVTYLPTRMAVAVTGPGSAHRAIYECIEELQSEPGRNWQVFDQPDSLDKAVRWLEARQPSGRIRSMVLMEYESAEPSNAKGMFLNPPRVGGKG